MVYAVPDAGQTQLLQYAGALMRLNFMNVHKAFHAVLLRHGMDQVTLDAWSKKADDGMFPLNTLLKPRELTFMSLGM